MMYSKIELSLKYQAYNFKGLKDAIKPGFDQDYQGSNNCVGHVDWFYDMSTLVGLFFASNYVASSHLR